ncbi:MAG: PIG-L family deacetylase [Thermaurantimonas sp.]|uniref:PIG-L family deacetylase n=1 Tax=Thermaurantimonas sp. TaxID=2681568 RepID=UPI00391A4655
MYIHRFLTISIFCTLTGYSQYYSSKSSSLILHEIEKLQNTARVLYVAAHPDDENTRLITWLANSQKATVAYLSLTRGEGGQNLIGPELDDALGVIRTHELLKAREIDGGLQFFTRARDFGYSKSKEESLRLWNEDSILKDIVLIIRKFKPDIIINRFPPDARAGHGHHAASAYLAIKAFDLAADPEYEPDIAATYGVWQATRLFWNTSTWWIKDLDTTQTGNGKLLKIEVGDYYPYLGAETGELAAYSRSQHKSQGFGIPASRGQFAEYLQLERGSPAYKELFENIQTGYARWGCPSLDKQAKTIALTFNHDKPNLSIYKLNEFKKAAQQCLPEPYLSELTQKIDDLIWQCSGVYAEAASNQSFCTEGDTLQINFQMFNRIGEMVFINAIETTDSTYKINRLIQPRQSVSIKIPHRITKSYSQPFWLRNPEKYLYLSEEQKIGKSIDEPLYLPITVDLEGAKIVKHLPIIFRNNDRVKGEIIEDVFVFPQITGTTDADVIYQVFDNTFYIALNIQTHKKLDTLHISVKKENDVEIQPDLLSLFRLQEGESKELSISGTTQKNQSSTIKFFYTSEHDSLELMSYKTISYDHIGKKVLFKPITVQLFSLENEKVKPLKIGYISGSGDDIKTILKKSGFHVEDLQLQNVTAEDLKKYDAIVCGIRSFNTSTILAKEHQKLLEYTKNGGTYIVLYQTNGADLKVKEIGPYPFTIGRGRVTEEDASPTILLPNHKVLKYPYEITKDDLTNWHQEIGLYFAENISPEYDTPLAWADTNELPQSGGLIIGKYGKGIFVYTGLSFFRQLPNGNAGAFKLLINILHLNQ